MADKAMIVRLADSHEFAELRRYWSEHEEGAVGKLGRQAFADPDNHDKLEAHKLKAFYAGIDAALGLPLKERSRQQREENK